MTSRKTTFILDEDLYREVRKRAAGRGSSVSALVAEALREYLFRSEQRSKAPVKLIRAEGGGWIGPADPRSNAELFAAMDEGVPPEGLR